jgi:SAM-dependent methyltransferase
MTTMANHDKNPITSNEIYREDLARIHIEGYGFHWEQAAPAVLSQLRERGINAGLVVDLGCGGGQWLARLSDEGYQVCGVDISPSMIRAAQERVPAADLILGSFADVDLPACDAVTALGEPINYLPDGQAINRTFRRVYQALRPGGLFIFDAREPAPKPEPTRVATRLDDDWACIACISERAQDNLIVREITTFWKVGSHYRRREERHQLKVFAPDQTIAWLTETGFEVQSYDGYGDYRFTQRQSVFVALKPHSA